MPQNVRDLGKLIVAKGFKKLFKVQKIAQSGHTAAEPLSTKKLKKKNLNNLGTFLIHTSISCDVFKCV